MFCYADDEATLDSKPIPNHSMEFVKFRAEPVPKKSFWHSIPNPYRTLKAILQTPIVYKVELVLAIRRLFVSVYVYVIYIYFFLTWKF